MAAMKTIFFAILFAIGLTGVVVAADLSPDTNAAEISAAHERGDDPIAEPNLVEAAQVEALACFASCSRDSHCAGTCDLCSPFGFCW